MITEQQIREVQRIVVAEANPERVYLFGSLATGEQHEDSDMDLLVVVPEELNEQLRLQVMMNLRKSTYKKWIEYAENDLLVAKNFS